MKKNTLLILLLTFSLNGFSQVYDGVPLDDVMLRAGYNHTSKSKNTGFLGVGYVVGDAFLASASFYSGIHYLQDEQNAKIIPEIGVDAHLVVLSAGVCMNTQAIQPKLGIALFSLAHITAGYSIPISKEKLFKGFTLGVHVQIPIWKVDNLIK